MSVLSDAKARYRMAGETDAEALERESRRDFISSMIRFANAMTADQRQWVLLLARAEAMSKPAGTAGR